MRGTSVVLAVLNHWDIAQRDYDNFTTSRFAIFVRI